MGIDVFWHPDVLRHDTGSGVFEAASSPLLEVPELHPEGNPLLAPGSARRGRAVA